MHAKILQNEKKNLIKVILFVLCIAHIPMNEKKCTFHFADTGTGTGTDTGTGTFHNICHFTAALNIVELSKIKMDRPSYYISKEKYDVIFSIINPLS